MREDNKVGRRKEKERERARERDEGKKWSLDNGTSRRGDEDERESKGKFFG